MSDEIKKSNYGPKGTAAGAQYQSHANQERKQRNVETISPLGPNKNVKAYSSKVGQLSSKQQAAAESKKSRVKALSGKPRTLSRDEIAVLGNDPTKIIKDEDKMLEVTSDGKQEVVEGKEPLKKDPKNRWTSLKKALDHNKAFMSLEDEMGANEEEQPAEPQATQEQDSAIEGSEEPSQGDQGEEEQPTDDSPGSAESPLEAVSAGDQGEEEQPANEDNDDADPELSPEDEEKVEQVQNGELDPQELIDALKEEGYSDQEISYIVHGHHAPEVDPSKQAKAQATTAMNEVEMDNAGKMAELERQHTLASMEHERSHKQRMSDLEYDDAQNKRKDIEMEQAHKQRMLDLEYERAKHESTIPEDDSGDAEAAKEMKRLEVEKKRLELRLREQEMKLELEFKQREHELKLKMMEQQFKEQAKQKSEIGGIKHQQKLAEAKNPPVTPAKKPLKKSEEYDE